MKIILVGLALFGKSLVSAVEINTLKDKLEQAQTTYTLPYYFSNKIPYVNYTFQGTNQAVPLMLDLQIGQHVAWECNNTLCT